RLGPLWVLVLDAASTRMVSACCKMSDILSEGVTSEPSTCCSPRRRW
uniref:ESPL1 protein n=1 Tax=Nothoprocta perdicaria TaxID=30464 RepID=A0A8C6ZQF3_NOTPE